MCCIRCRVSTKSAVEVDDDPRAKYFVQAQNSVYVRMALILMLLNIEPGLFEEETVC